MATTRTIFDEGSLMPKKDSEGRMYREVRCPECHAWLCDEYIIKGRTRHKCFRCGRIIIMVFKPKRSNRPGPESSKQELNHGKHS
jgi:DNA-directed RNA polymerase subunit RPC12/RpoP